MAMLPFCGYNMADYWAHWLRIGQRQGANLPKIYYVNWFRKSADGGFLWPGFGENSRVLKGVFERCEGTAKAVETPIGNLPAKGELDVSGLDVSEQDLEELLRVDVEGWLAEVPGIREYYETFEGRVPKELSEELEALKQRLESARR
jgi:phosphoenolpyruvate carboxykinase (GTP)